MQVRALQFKIMKILVHQTFRVKLTTQIPTLMELWEEQWINAINIVKMKLMVHKVKNPVQKVLNQELGAEQPKQLQHKVHKMEMKKNN